MQAQPSLFHVGRAGLPARVLAFASGANEAREIRGFALASVPVGFSAAAIREEGVRELLASQLPVFADSGAFSEVAITAEGPKVARPISDRSWLERLALYLRLAGTLGELLYVVAPDRVADQKETLRLVRRYRVELQATAQTGAHVLIPVQRGELSAEAFYAAAVDAAGIPLVPALPMKKAAMSAVDVLHFVNAVRPGRLHLLGMGYERRKSRALVRILLRMDAGLSVSLDSNRLRAVTGRERSLTLAEKALRHSPAGSLHGEVEHDALGAAAQRLDYTDLVAFPSSWADRKPSLRSPPPPSARLPSGRRSRPTRTATSSKLGAMGGCGSVRWSKRRSKRPGNNGSSARYACPYGRRPSGRSSPIAGSPCRERSFMNTRITKEQQRAILCKYRQNPDGSAGYLAFRRRVRVGFGCLMLR